MTEHRILPFWDQLSAANATQICITKMPRAKWSALGNLGAYGKKRRLSELDKPGVCIGVSSFAQHVKVSILNILYCLPHLFVDLPLDQSGLQMLTGKDLMENRRHGHQKNTGVIKYFQKV